MAKEKRYLNIPNEILMNKDLGSTEKIILSEIKTLAVKEGFCFASNKHFAEMCKVSTSTITRHVASLEKEEYVTTYTSTSGKYKSIRRIYFKRGTHYIILPAFRLYPLCNLMSAHSKLRIPYKQIEVWVSPKRLLITTVSITPNNTICNTTNKTAKKMLEPNKDLKNNDATEVIMSPVELIIPPSPPENKDEQLNPTNNQPKKTNNSQPTLKEVIEHFVSQGMTTVEAETWFDVMEKKNWLAKDGSRIVNWKAYANSVIKNKPKAVLPKNTSVTDELAEKLHSLRCNEGGNVSHVEGKLLSDLMIQLKKDNKLSDEELKAYVEKRLIGACTYEFYFLNKHFLLSQEEWERRNTERQTITNNGTLDYYTGLVNYVQKSYQPSDKKGLKELIQYSEELIYLNSVEKSKFMKWVNGYMKEATGT